MGSGTEAAHEFNSSFGTSFRSPSLHFSSKPFYALPPSKPTKPTQPSKPSKPTQPSKKRCRASVIEEYARLVVEPGGKVVGYAQDDGERNIFMHPSLLHGLVVEEPFTLGRRITEAQAAILRERGLSTVLAEDEEVGKQAGKEVDNNDDEDEGCRKYWRAW